MKKLAECLESGQAYYEIRLESIGGLGANLCGKMLGELGIKYLGLNAGNFSSYGSEKTGTPVKGHIRYCDAEKEIRLHSPVVKPDILAVFHQALLKNPEVTKGCHKDTGVIIALETGCEISEAFTLPGECDVYGLEAQRIATETKSRINVVMLGAILKVMGVESIEAGEKICKDTLGKKYPEAIQKNIEGMRRGYDEVRRLDGIKRNQGLAAARKTECTWGYATAPTGGINPRFGSSVVADVSPSRQGYIPVFLKEKCINCGQCNITCPDMVFQFVRGEYKGRKMMINQGLDYYHCKGCLRCVDICPTQALVRGEEAEHKSKKYFMPNKDLIRTPEYYEKSGPDGYITSESYYTEKRPEGGEV